MVWVIVFQNIGYRNLDTARTIGSRENSISSLVRRR
jgi:hypothetical protein